MNEKAVKSVIEYAKRLSDGGLVGEFNFISLREDAETMLITKHGADFSALDAANVLEVKLKDVTSCCACTRDEAVRHAGIYSAREDIGCVMHTTPFNATTCANAAVTIPPVLDDMSQIVGANIKTARDSSAFAVVKALKGRNACLIKNEGMLSCGRTLDEAFTACFVLEKAAKTFIEGTCLGGCVKLGLIDANLQRFIYKKKYSKANQAAKSAEEK